MVRADLHSHSTASDGALAPADLVRAAAERGLTHLALTDHDTCAGLREAMDAAKSTDLTLIPGVEITCEFRGQVMHLLGLGITPESEELEAFNKRTRESRRERFLEMIRLLEVNCGIPGLQKEFTQDQLDTRSLTRPDLARALVSTGHVERIQEAFERWLAEGQPAYVPHQVQGIHDAIDVIRKAGGVSILAHCGKYPKGVRQCRTLLDEGMDGVEVFHPDHDKHTRQRLLDIAGYRQKIITGGADFHSFEHTKSSCFGELYIGEDHFDHLWARMEASKGVAAG